VRPLLPEHWDCLGCKEGGIKADIAAWTGNEFWTCTSMLSRYAGGTDRRQAALSEKSRINRIWAVISRKKRETDNLTAVRLLFISARLS
jgi:hypothetical protein